MLEQTSVGSGDCQVSCFISDIFSFNFPQFTSFSFFNIVLLVACFNDDTDTQRSIPGTSRYRNFVVYDLLIYYSYVQICNETNRQACQANRRVLFYQRFALSPRLQSDLIEKYSQKNSE